MIPLKKIFLFIVCLLPWFLSSLFPMNFSFYESLNLPFFTPPNWFYGVFWTITYIGIALSISSLISDVSYKNIPRSYKKTLIINYLFNQSFTLLFFTLQSTFFGFISCIGTFVSALFLYEETSNLSEKSVKYLNPYLLLSLFATILSLTIYLMNV